MSIAPKSQKLRMITPRVFEVDVDGQVAGYVIGHRSPWILTETTYTAEDRTGHIWAHNVPDPQQAAELMALNIAEEATRHTQSKCSRT